MSKIIDRGKEALSFINCNKFGIETFSVIHNFGLSVDRNISTLEAYGNLFDNLNKNELVSKSNTRHVTSIKQQIILDAIMKTQIIIESTLILIHSLSIGYHQVAMNMTYYDFNLKV